MGPSKESFEECLAPLAAQKLSERREVKVSVSVLSCYCCCCCCSYCRFCRRSAGAQAHYLSFPSSAEGEQRKVSEESEKRQKKKWHFLEIENFFGKKKENLFLDVNFFLFFGVVFQCVNWCGFLNVIKPSLLKKKKENYYSV